MYVCMCVCMYVFTTERFFEVAIESWSDWDLNPRPYMHYRLKLVIWKN